MPTSFAPWPCHKVPSSRTTPPSALDGAGDGVNLAELRYRRFRFGRAGGGSPRGVCEIDWATTELSALHRIADYGRAASQVREGPQPDIFTNDHMSPDYSSKANMRFQSFFMLMTIQLSLTASS